MRKEISWIDIFTWGPSYWAYSMIVPVFLSTQFKSGSATYGLYFGLSSVLVGQISTIVYHILYNEIPLDKTLYNTVTKYVLQPEGFLLLTGYLSVYWVSGTMPTSYYTYEGGIYWSHIIYQLLLQDFFQYTMHRIEHGIPIIYKYSHQTHHKHINPQLFDSFDGSIVDTTCMILIPLWLTSRVIHTNVWSYMIFGTIYANMLTLIHSETAHPWDTFFRHMGIGTPYDHRIHHLKFKYNYGHIFTYWDWIFDTIERKSYE